MLQPLNRHSLSEQATTYLRDGIREGRWRGELPSEVQLCREMQVSRVTLRAARSCAIRAPTSSRRRSSGVDPPMCGMGHETTGPHQHTGCAVYDRSLHGRSRAERPVTGRSST